MELKRMEEYRMAQSEVEQKKGKSVIYDSDYEDMSNLNIIIKILSKSAKLLKLDDGMDYILKQSS